MLFGVCLTAPLFDAPVFYLFSESNKNKRLLFAENMLIFQSIFQQNYFSDSSDVLMISEKIQSLPFVSSTKLYRYVVQSFLTADSRSDS